MDSFNPGRGIRPNGGGSATSGRGRYQPGPGHGDGMPAGAVQPGDVDGDALLDRDFDLLVEKAIAAVRSGSDARPDAVFGPFAELNAIVRAVTYHEGRLLEWGLARLCADNPALALMPAETALPVVPAAMELLERNGWESLEGLRLRSEVHYRTSYMPDLFLVDTQNHAALLLDVKRSLASYAERRLNALRKRMMAAALIAGDWLHVEGRMVGVSRVDIAIVDGSNIEHDRTKGIFALDEVGELIGVAGAGQAMLALRAKFARRVRRELEETCRRALGRIHRTTAGSSLARSAASGRSVRDEGREAFHFGGPSEEHGVGEDSAFLSGGGNPQAEPRNDADADADDGDGYGDAGDGNAVLGGALSFAPPRRARTADWRRIAASRRQPIKVGFARGRDGP
ncbi:hypothetical protein RFM41_12130 [Mesorhizobium sp. VK25A]|uniref:Uncharacterized protein n=1 Tax=Mesorhizobium vachelliae TaxID=3072309 RepID=A0ABU4ZXE2_9HYPH|nr:MULTISPECIES: hypothetical protein [unclassified Mesorhizobium]MDX8530091.1 hypothetical protein [Mesorhizobium sp. VK25D]MDX8544489.1 hypothetical protein [Mesorhizobium sp. VK25A]